MTRPDGFYWVNLPGGWTIADWCQESADYGDDKGFGWSVGGDPRLLDDGAFAEIGPRISPPNAFILKKRSLTGRALLGLLCDFVPVVRDEEPNMSRIETHEKAEKLLLRLTKADKSLLDAWKQAASYWWYG